MGREHKLPEGQDSSLCLCSQVPRILPDTKSMRMDVYLIVLMGDRDL